ncbi:MAG: transglutaminase family protein [Anaerolineae bacterium]|nr:transglutaminase family protein [Anaerolineae bacterium]
MVNSLLGSIAYKFIASILIVAITTTSSIPLAQHLPKAMSAYLEMMQRIGLLSSNTTLLKSGRPVVPQDVSEEIADFMPSISQNGEPVGFLLNASVLQMNAEDFAPPSVLNPISVSRIQSAYAASNAISNTLIITFTVTNNQSPSIVPDIPVTATITDTLAAISALDFSQDSNAIRNVLLTDVLLPDNAAYLSAEPVPDRSADSLAWNLGDVPPLGILTATLRLQVPTSVVTFTHLDTGAEVWGTLQGRTVFAETSPTHLAPDELAQWLVWTVDANYYDAYLVQKASELGNEWQAMFAYARSLGYESYKGSLRGTRGTLWSEAGNSLDQASLLIAMLRGSGIPARYRHGTLITGTAQALILSMFPDVQGIIGHIPADAEFADLANDHHQDLMAVLTDTDTPTGHTLAWDFGDGTTVSGTLTPTHAYGDNGGGNFIAAGSPPAAFTVTLTVTDTTGLSVEAGVVVAVANVAPSVSIWWLGDD